MTNTDICAMIGPKSKSQHVYLFKASWRATALLFKVTARNFEEAEVKAARQVFKMQGGIFCLEIIFVKQLS